MRLSSAKQNGWEVRVSKSNHAELDCEFLSGLLETAFFAIGVQVDVKIKESKNAQA